MTTFNFNHAISFPNWKPKLAANIHEGRTFVPDRMDNNQTHFGLIDINLKVSQ